MSRKKPNIITPYDTKGQSNDLIQNIFDDMFVSHHTPNSLNLDGIIITLTLTNKKFLDEEVKIDSSSDYVDIYLQSIKISSDKYEIIDDGTNIVVTFNQALVAEPDSLVANDFLVKGKIVSR
tara:strand:+ start:2521 stop:2886 length:366 start_codon:yes stop_codon:yes gene_type:complete